jgi:Phosphodiester glycosidase
MRMMNVLSRLLMSSCGMVWTVSMGLWVVEAVQPQLHSNETNLYPLQFVPIVSSPEAKLSKQINFTMWTPQNWTESTLITLRNNVYMLTTHAGRSFQVIAPLSRMKEYATTDTIRDHTNHVPLNEPGGVTAIRGPIHHSFVSDKTRWRSRRSSRTKISKPIERSLLQRTSIQSANHNCTFAMNGGPFHLDGSSVGVLVKDGTTLSNDFGPNIGFGIGTVPSEQKSYHPNTTCRHDVASYHSFWVIGRLDHASQVVELGIQQFVTGFDWLVYNYSNIVPYRNNTTGAYRASRSAVGVAANGTLFLIVTDGCEHWYD